MKKEIKDENDLRVQAYDLRANKGLSAEKVAKQLGVNAHRVTRWVKEMKKKYPKLPDILTPFQFQVKQRIEDGCTPEQISIILKRSLASVYRVTAKLKLLHKKPKTVSYIPEMDKYIEKKF